MWISEPEAERPDREPEELLGGEDVVVEKEPAERSPNRLHSDDAGAVKGAEI